MKLHWPDLKLPPINLWSMPHMSKDPKSNYYDAGGIETLDIIKAKLPKEQFIGFLRGNVIKYACRMSHKGTPERDAEKIEHYAHFLNEELRNPDETPKDYEMK